MHAAYGHGSVLFRLCCDMLRTSGFVDDVVFIPYRANGHDVSLYLGQVGQVAVSAGTQTTTV